MATLTNTKIKDTYDSLLKISDNGVVEATEQVVTDGLGNNTVLSIGTGSASFSSDIEVNGLTIGKGNSSVITNTALGRDALDVNTTGSFNTAIGSSSMNLNTTGGSNVAVGASSLASNVSSSFNTAIGVAALQDNTASSNTAVGYNSLSSNTTGEYNTASGYRSLEDNTTGDGNTAFGTTSLTSNTEGNHNTALGYLSLNDVTTGDGNVGVGFNTGNTLTTGSNNIYVGYGIQASATDITNEIVIGASATGNGSNTATYGNASITSHNFTSGQVNVAGNLAVDTDTLFVDASNNRVGIGTNLPTADLQIENIGSSFIYMSSGTASPATVGMRMGSSINSEASAAEVSYDVQDDLFQIKTNSTGDRRLTIERVGGKVSVMKDFAVDTNTLYVDAANNQVGIGTSSPTSIAGFTALTIDNNSSGSFIDLLNSGSDSLRFLALSTADQRISAAGTFSLYSGSSSDMVFNAGGSERMRIDSSGRVDISGAINNAVTFDRQLQTRGALVSGITGTATAQLYLHRDDVTINSGDIIGELNYSAADGGSYVGAAITAIAANNWGGSNSPTHLSFQTADTGLNMPTERMRIDSSGNVLVNNGNIQLVDSNKRITVDGSDIRIWQRSSANIQFLTADQERMRIDSSGNVLVGDTGSGLSSAGRGVIEINGASSSILGLKVGGTVKTYLFQNGDDVELNNTANGIMAFKTNSAERMRITSGGDVLIAAQSTLATDNGVKIFGQSGSLLGSIAQSKDYSSGTIGYVYFETSGGSGTLVGSITYNGSSVSYNTSSDYRLKENVVEMTGALDRVDALKPSQFNFIGQERVVDGFLAHEVQAIVPEAVTGEKDAVDEEGNPIYQGIDQSKIVPLLVGAIKELRAEIELLKSQLNA